MPAGAPGRAALPGLGVDGAARGMAAGDRRWRPLRYQSLAALVEDSQWPFLFLVSDFSYGADDYDGEGNEEQKGPPEGSETMPYKFEMLFFLLMGRPYSCFSECI